MPHEFKIGDIVKYRPTHRDRRTPTSECTVIALLPETDGKFEYRIRHVSEDFDKVAQESELLPA